MEMHSDLLIAGAIAVCEAAFWVLLLAGLATRYVFGRGRLSDVLLLCVPLVDLVLLVISTTDLARGATATWAHGLAAVYLGFGVGFGPSIVAAADRRMAARHGVAKARPDQRTAGESPLAAHWRLWRRAVLASLVAGAVLGAMVLVAGDAERTRALWAGGGWFAQLGALCTVWLLLGPVWTAAAQRIHLRPTPPRRKEPT